jgi:hypothetical protein
MPRSNRRAATRRGPDRRILGAAAALVVFGGIIGVTQISNADTGPTGQPAAQTQAVKQINGLDVLATTCEDSTLAPHDGFQKGDRCVSTEFGEVGSAANNPSLLITSAPRAVTVNTPFQLKVSTRNLIRDRFLAAGKGGYYVESSVLQDGIVRGHFHTACRMLTSTKTAPAPDPVPAFFVATEDKQGGKTPDTVTISVPGLPTTGTAQCASWAGDGSHRIPMMERANQTPALDAVRIQVRAGQQGGGVQPGSGQSGSGGAVPTPTATSGPTPPPKTQPAPSATSGPTPPKTQPTPSATSGPTPPAKPQPITKSTVTRSTTAPAAPAGAGTQTAARGSNNADAAPPESTDAAPADSADRTTADGAGQTTAPEPTTTSRKATKKAAKAEPVSTDEAVEEQDASPDSAQPAAQEQDQQTTDAAKPAAANKPLALTGINTLAIIGGGAILLTIGVFVLSTSRRRRVHHWRG